MKSIFGFITGAALGVGSLYGLRKVFKLMEPAEATAPAAPIPPISRPVTTPPVNDTPKVEVGKAAETLTPENPTAKMVEDLEKAQDAVGKLEKLMSFAGEPAARHEEPVAAVESAPEAVTPRSETAEEAVPEKIEVVPASPASAAVKKTPTKTTATEKKAPKTPAKSAKTAPAKPDDFTVIVDIGLVFNQKLHDAGINSFKELADLTPAQVEEKTDIPAERVERGQWISQARKLAAGETNA